MSRPPKPLIVRLGWRLAEPPQPTVFCEATSNSRVEELYTLPHGTRVLEALESEIDQGRRVVVFDLGNLERVDSSVIGDLLGARKLVVETGGSLGLVNVGAKIVETFYLTKLDQVFTVYPSLRKALAKL